MKCLVTGGAGFIGSHLTERLLAEGHDVVVLDNFSNGRPKNLEALQKNSGLKVVQADVSDSSAIEPHFRAVDWVFHLAALADIVPSIQDPRAYYQSNVQGTFCVLEAARRHQIKRFVYAASSSCYGIPDIYPTPETTPIAPQYPYALTKRMGEEMVLHWAQVYKFPAMSLRFFNVYGPRSRTNGTYGAVFGVFLAQKLANQPFTVVGDGRQTRDFTFVTDVVAACVAAAQSSVVGEVLNVGSGNPQSVNRLVELLGGPVTYIPKRPGEPDVTQADVRKIKKLLGWEVKVGFEAGVKIMLENIDYWREATVWTPQTISKATQEWFTYLSK